MVVVAVSPSEIQSVPLVHGRLRERLRHIERTVAVPLHVEV